MWLLLKYNTSTAYQLVIYISTIKLKNFIYFKVIEMDIKNKINVHQDTPYLE